MAASSLIAAALHVGVLAGVDWPSPPPARLAPTIQISLSGYSSRASHHSPAQQQEQDAGSATAAPAEQPQPSLPPQPTESAPPAPKVAKPAAVPRVSPFAGRAATELARAIAANDAGPAVPPRTENRTLRLANGASTSVDFAYYLRSWRRKVERIGQLNYPQRAKQQGIAGGLRLLVVIAADGALLDVRVLESSGHQLLDDAALRIVRLAAPYAPFSPTMRAAADVLEIERTWQFRDSRLSF